MKNSLYGLGLPIVQGAISTILGVVGLMIAPSYIFVTFFKMVFLVICLGAMHGLFLLPVLLSLFGPGSCTKEEKQKIKSPATSYMSDGDSLPAPLKRSMGSLEGFGEEGLRIPRPATMISLTSSSATPTTDVETSGSSPGGSSGQQPAAVDTKQKQRSRRRRSRGGQVHEMYTNNGYLSEEDMLEDRRFHHAAMMAGGSLPPGAPRLYYNNYNGGFFPPYAYPVDTNGGQHHQHHSSSDRRRCKSNDCKRKRPKH